MADPAEMDAGHNHVTRDIKPRGQCPGCDRYHNRHSAEKDTPVRVEPPKVWNLLHERLVRLSPGQRTPSLRLWPPLHRVPHSVRRDQRIHYQANLECAMLLVERSGGASRTRQGDRSMSTTLSTKVTYQVEYSYEATTLDYLSPRWYPMGEPTEDKDAADLLCEVQQERHSEAGGEPCMFRVRTIPSEAQRQQWVDEDAAANAMYWAGRAAEARRMEDARKAFFALKGQQVVVVKGRKVPLGTTGECFWIGEDKYSRTGGYRVGMKDAEGTVHWTSASNIEAVAG